MKFKFFLISLAVLLALAAGGLFYFNFFSGEKPVNLEADAVIIKTAIESDGTFYSPVRISNLDSAENTYEIKINNIESFVSLDSYRLTLKSKDSKKINLVFSNKERKPDGIYLGDMRIVSEKETLTIPILIEIESKKVYFDSSILLFPNSKIMPGDKLTADIKIFDLFKMGTSDVEFNYFVKDFEGKTIDSESENLVVKDQVLVSKSFELPKNTAQGDYVFGVIVKYKNSTGTSSSFFRVSSGESRTFFIDEKTFFIGIFVIFILLWIFSTLYSVYSRDRLLDELKEQYKKELWLQEKCLINKEKENERVLKTHAEKSLNKEIFKRIKKERRKAVKRVHKEREKKIRVLKKQNKKNEIGKQIANWKKEGYDTSLFEEKIKRINPDYIRSRLKEWKRKGYATEVIEQDLNRKV